jgi:hypothetical protein
MRYDVSVVAEFFIQIVVGPASVLALVCRDYTHRACFRGPIAVSQFAAAQGHLAKPHFFTAHVVDGRPWVGLRDVDCHNLRRLPRLEVLEWFRSRSLRRETTLPCSPLAAGGTPVRLDDVERKNGYSRKFIVVPVNLQLAISA